jgi:hypothetical protein
VVGIDGSAAAIAHARRGAAGAAVEFRTGDITEPGLGDRLAAERGEDVRRADRPWRGVAAEPVCDPAPSVRVRKSLQHLKRLANNVDH